MSEIASKAGVTRQLLYLHFDSRTALLVELSRRLDASARTPELQATIDDAPTGREALRAAVRVQAAIKPKIYALATSLELLAPNDDAAAAAIAERESARHGRCRAVIRRVRQEGDLASGWSAAAATDLMWSATSLRAWVELVKGRRWSSATWIKRTTAVLESSLLKDIPTSPSAGGA
jgi:AcrR family transcriptional regulator